MANALAECGHNVIVLTGQAKGKPEEETKNNVTILRKYNLNEAGSRRVLHLALHVIDRYSIDHIEGADYLGDCARLLTEKNRPPVLIKVHSCNILKAGHEAQIYYWWQRPLIKGALLRNWQLTLREKRSIERANLLTFPSQRILFELEQQRCRLPEKRIILPNPIKVTKPEVNTEASSPTILLVCRLDIGKGIQYIPHIVRQLVGEIPDLVVEIAGGDGYARGLGSMKSWLIKKSGNLARHLSFLGHLEKEELDYAYKRAWVIILPSRWDNFPTVVLEAMAHGKPVVASPHGGMPEMLAGTLSQIALPDSDLFPQAIARLLRSARLRKDVGDSMYEKAKTAYAPEVIAQAYIDFIGDI